MKKIVLLIICLHSFLVPFCKGISEKEASLHTKNIFPPPPPDTILHSGSTTFCQGGNRVLTVPTGTSAPFKWLLNGTPIGGATAANYTATASGTYTVITNGPDTSQPLTLTANPVPTAGFTFTPNNQCSNIPVQFTNTSTGGTSYAWNFGDVNSSNNTSATTNPSHVFIGTNGSATQSFSTQLITTNSFGCTATASSTITTKQVSNTDLTSDGIVSNYNGVTYFASCSNNNTATFNFQNQSGTNNTNYVLQWGDASADYNNSTFSGLIAHDYRIGGYPLNFIVTNQNGCIDTGFYHIFVGGNPAVGLGNPGNTSICTGNSLTFPISNTSSNSPGTIYTVTFNDGSAPITYVQPAPADVTHTFLTTSCGTNSPGYNNSFSANIQASNPCQSSSATVVPIYVSQKPDATFTVTPGDTVCVNNAITLASINPVNSNNVSGTCSAGKIVWKISPATGWTISSGSLGTDAGQANPNFWTSGTSPLVIVFNQTGTYTVKFKMGNSTCGLDSTTQTICVNPEPVASFTIDQNMGCAPYPVVATSVPTSATCGNNTNQWTVTYTATAGCIPNTSSFSFTGGTNATSINPKFQFNNPGVYTITLVTTSPGGGCASAPVSQTVTVQGKPKVTLTAPPSVCQNLSINPSVAASCYTAAATYAWTFTGGSPGSSTNPNPGAITYNTLGPFNISLGVTNTCGTTTVSQPITVNDVTAAIAGPKQNKCGTSTTMAGNSPSSGTGQWSTISGPNIPNIVTPSSPTTSITNLIPGTYIFEWLISNGPCSSASEDTVIISGGPTPAMAGADQNLCSVTTTALQGNIPFVGSGVWTFVSGPNTPTIVTPSSPTSSITGLIPGVYTFRWTISFSSCTPDSDDVQITISTPPVTALAGNDQTICSTTATMQGNDPGTGTGQWALVIGPNIPNIVTPSSPTTSITGLIPGTYSFQWKISNGACTDSRDTVQINVTAGPTPAHAGNDQSLCAIDSTQLQGNIPIVGTGLWKFVSGPNAPTIVNTSSPTSTVRNLVTGTYIFRWTISNGICPPDSDDVQIIVYANATVSNAGPRQDICTASTTMAANTAIVGTGVWAFVNGPNAPTIVTLSSPTTTINNLISGTYVFSWTITNGACSSTSNDTLVVAALATTAVAGNDQTLCDSPTVILTGNTPSNGTGTWSYVSGPTGYTITNTADPGTTVTGLTPGIYVFRWTITNNVCPPNSDDVQITVLNDLQNIISTVTPTICSGQTVLVSGQLPTGGNGTYTYQWQQSSNGTTWTDIPLATAPDYTTTLIASTYFRRQVTSLPCQTYSNTILITVQPPIANNTIAANQGICINTAPALINGSVPTGGDGVYSYQWQQSTDTVTWTDISLATNKDYAPGTLTLTTLYRRNVTTTLCTGPQSSVSDTVTVTVHPNAKAVINVTRDTICISAGIPIQNISPAGFNGSYNWYANNNFVGSGTSFPGYSIPQAGDSVTIKMVAISLYGCVNDSVSHTFHSFPNPNPSFTASDTNDCGPLTVLFTNTTPSMGNYNYKWDFGNGQISTAAQPGNIVFATNPNFGDTVYLVKMAAYNICDTEYYQVHVMVHSKPNAIFTPDKTSACSPTTITFTNVSQGLGMSYNWSFGDGATLATASDTPVQHVYHTSVQQLFNVKLFASNACGVDSSNVNILITPNTINLNFAIDGATLSGCIPLTVKVINNSAGANLFKWDFGDGGTLNTTNNKDTLFHTYTQVGNFNINVEAQNNCSDTSAFKTVQVFQTPVSGFTMSANNLCIGDSVFFTNTTDTATAYSWDFGDGTNSNATDPHHAYHTPGTYSVVMVASLLHSNGTTCTDTTTKTITVVSSLQGNFTVSDSTSICAPLTVIFTNHITPNVSSSWNFGDGSAVVTGDIVSHTYPTAGTYIATDTVIVAGGCIYVAQKTITIAGPAGSFQYIGGYTCTQPVRFEATTSNTDSLKWDFGDGQTITTTQHVIFHNYTFPGTYLPRLSLISNSGCSILITGVDSIKIDHIQPGFTAAQQHKCGYTIVTYTDTTHAYFGVNTRTWDFGDGTTGTGLTVTHNYSSAGTYSVQLAIVGNSGCMDTAVVSVSVQINTIPIASIPPDPVDCTNRNISFNATIQSPDPINIIRWTSSNGLTGNSNPFVIDFIVPGTYTIQLIAGTIGCYDTTSTTIQINPSPQVFASNNVTICRGNSTQLSATGAPQFSWSPLQGLSCNLCANPVANPLQSTNYLVTATNSFGCTASDSVLVTVIQPFRINASPNDSICIGQSADLLATGAVSYAWSPAQGLNSTNIPNPVATPTVTTQYMVVGYDAYNCFTDTAYVIVGIGQYPTVSLGADQTLSSGTLFTFNPVIQNGPIRNWLWSPSADLSCNNCPNPVATVKDNITYELTVTTDYGCSASDSMHIKAFCENTQLYIPDAFTPDGDNINDIMMVRGEGFNVKSFRIFNRWGQLVFERENFPPNDPQYGWDGKINGVVGEPEVYVYTAEVICDNGVSYIYKGNISLLK
jgi:gliding motility-associated-like protein